MLTPQARRATRLSREPFWPLPHTSGAWSPKLCVGLNFCVWQATNVPFNNYTASTLPFESRGVGFILQTPRRPTSSAPSYICRGGNRKHRTSPMIATELAR